jgi:aarF domain-containing kinase
MKLISQIFFCLKFLVNCLAKIFPDFKFVWLAEETKRNLPIELDFTQEAQNIEKVTQMLKAYPFVRVPKVYFKYCSDRILTMEYCEGVRVDDLEYMKANKINPNKVKKSFKEIYLI